MRNIFRALPAAIFLVSMLAPTAAAQGLPPIPEPPAVGMTSGILLDLETGKVLWARNERALQSPASLTKILTALIVLENLDLDQEAVITPDARAAPGARTYAEQGWTFSVRELLWGMLLQSGNDAAIALAHRASPDGTVEGFMKLANARAAKMGARDTHFRNPHGYDSAGHLTTARDLALITAAAMREPVFAEMVASRSHQLTWGDGQPHTFFNHNKLLLRYPGTVGIKTGFTRSAGHCLASAVTRNGATLVAIVLNSPNHYGESTSLYDWAFTNLPALRARSTDTIRPAGGAADLVLYPDIAQTGAKEQRTGIPFSEGLPLLALGIALSMTMLIVFRESILNP
jgi:serine-type D-Ala-D-Ala carboxypeptidase (penicillin-binding protein 5/6)